MVADTYTEPRLAMVDHQLVARKIGDPAVLKAMRTVPREVFVPSEYADVAYEDRPLPIGEGQTISQPYIVALMAEALQLSPHDRVLEIGTGSGYQAAILSKLVRQVVSVERIRALADQARTRLRELRCGNVQVMHSNGEWGWSRGAPYDAIIVTAAPDRVPRRLLSQLTEEGTLVIPVGDRGTTQRLLRISRSGEQLAQEELELVSFVPFLQGCI